LLLSQGNTVAEVTRQIGVTDLIEKMMDFAASTTYIESENPSENGYCESINGKIRDEFNKKVIR
jgi:hypothetical protein